MSGPSNPSSPKMIPVCPQEREAVVNPRKGRRSPAVGPTLLLAGTQGDLRYLVDRCFKKPPAPCQLYLGSVFSDPEERPGFTLAGPVLGAPFAAMMLETLVAWGAETVWFMGWCGAVSPKVSVGDIVVPTSAFIDEGTSRHYGTFEKTALPDPLVTRRIQEGLGAAAMPFEEGPIWTMDAIFRETREKVLGYQANGVLVVEMEFSALCSVSRFRGAAMGGLLVVSDSLSDLEWRPGFKDPRFKAQRKAAADTLARIALAEALT